MYSHKLVNSYNLSLTVLKHTSIYSINSQPNNNTHFQIHKSSSIQVLSYRHQIKRHTKYRRRWKSSLKQKTNKNKNQTQNHILDMAVISKQRFDRVKKNNYKVPDFQ